MKRVFPLLASAHLALGQTTVVTFFDEEQGLDLPSIGIIPIEDYQKATAEIERLQKELAAALKKKANVEAVGAVVTEQKKVVQTLRNQLRQAQRQEAGILQKEQANFAEREKAMVERVNAMEKNRAQATQKFQKRIATLQSDFGRKEGEWKRKLLFVEGERDDARNQLAKLRTEQKKNAIAFEESVQAWRRETENAARTAQMKQAQEAVANTARLAADWEEERKGLEARMAELQALRAEEKVTWEKSVADWQERAKKAVRTANVKEAQAAVANTARLAADWQSERAQLESQVEGMTAKLAKLEGQLGVQGFENQQTEVLRLGLMQKSKALEDLGSDAAQLAMEWKKERENARRELDAMRDLYKSTVKDVKTRDQRVLQLDTALAEKDAALEMLAGEATKLSSNWKEQRGGLQKKISTLEKKLAACQKKLQTTSKKSGGQSDQKLAEQMAVVADMQSKFALAKKREDSLKSGLVTLKEEVAKCKKEVLSFKSQKEKDAQALAALKAELKQVKANYASAERDLVKAGGQLKSSRQQIQNLSTKSGELTNQLAQARKELEAARKQAEANKKAKAEAAEKAAQVNNLEDQLGRLAVAQQELEGTLIATLGDFEKLQTSYVNLKKESAGGGEAAAKAIAARKVAEAELAELQKQLQGKEAKLEQARERVQEVEKEQDAVKADAEAGKAALGKCEAELQKARREMGHLQLGKEALAKEAEELRKRFVSIEPVRYQLASANVVAQQQRVLAEVKQVLEVYPEANFSIKGHTCNIGSEDANLKLSEDRAMVLRDFLVANGIEGSRFTLVEGCGDTEPQASNETDEGRRQNRRVEIQVVR